VATLRDPASGMSATATRTTVTSATELTAEFGALPFAPAARLTFAVRNPDGCDAALVEAVLRKTGSGACP
jgi:hypothetical protein